MSNLLKERRALAKLRPELKEKKGKMCQYCKKFGHLAQNCKNKKERAQGTTVP